MVILNINNLGVKNRTNGKPQKWCNNIELLNNSIFVPNIVSQGISISVGYHKSHTPDIGIDGKTYKTLKIRTNSKKSDIRLALRA